MNAHKIAKFLAIATTTAALYLTAATAHGAEKAPANMKPLATCNDGKTEYSATGDHRGACSGHGGVKSWADGSPVKSHKRATEYR